VRESLKSADACGGGKIEGDGRIPGPGRCEAGSDNEHILKRWQLCLEDRETQAAAFASGLNDIKAARKIKWANNGQAIKEYLKEIQGKIKDDQPGHAEEIRGVKNAIAHCQKFHPQHGDGASNIPIPTPIEILTLD
jgi:hypothetical protein